MNPASHQIWSASLRRLLDALAPVPTDLEPQLNPLPGVRVVLFDVYGTLLISASGDIEANPALDAEHSFAEAVHAAGLRAKGPLGGKLREKIQHHHARARAAGIDYPEVDILGLWQELAAELLVDVPDEQQLGTLAIEYEGRVNPVWAMPGFPEVLSALSPHLVRGVVSNAQFYTPLTLEVVTDQSLAQLGFQPDYCAWSYQCGVAKPSLRLLKSVLERTGVAPEQVVMVGNDLAKDVAPARALGCRAVLFAGDRRSLRADPARLRDPATRPDAIVTQLSQLPALL